MLFQLFYVFVMILPSRVAFNDPIHHFYLSIRPRVPKFCKTVPFPRPPGHFCAVLAFEIDFNAKWNPKKYFFFSGGYSILLTGAAGEERLGSTDPLHYLYLMSGINFKTR